MAYELSLYWWPRLWSESYFSRKPKWKVKLFTLIAPRVTYWQTLKLWPAQRENLRNAEGHREETMNMERPLTLLPVLNKLSHAEVPKWCLRSASVGSAENSPLLFTQNPNKGSSMFRLMFTLATAARACSGGFHLVSPLIVQSATRRPLSWFSALQTQVDWLIDLLTGAKHWPRADNLQITLSLFLPALCPLLTVEITGWKQILNGIYCRSRVG